MLSSIPMDANILGFDVGARRIGVALGNRLWGNPRSLAVVMTTAQGVDWPAIDRLVSEWNPLAILVGDPMSIDGGDQPIRKYAQEFSKTLFNRYQKAVGMIDERCSSIEAAQRFAQLRSEGKKRRRDANNLDAMAAVIILERGFITPSSIRCISSI